MLKRKSNKPVVEFIDISNSIHETFHPQPAKKNIPDWYKNIEAYAEGFSNKSRMPAELNPSTIKKCIPVFDAITAGYIIVTPQDLDVIDGHPNPKNPSIIGKGYGWPDRGTMPIDYHSHDQAEGHPYTQNQLNVLGDIPKFKHPWTVKTPLGYSCLFTPPVHRETPIKVMEGIVDTDAYFSPVNLPFTFNDPNFTGLIPAGTPLVQVIPFKRESYEHKVMTAESMGENLDRKIETAIMSTFFNSYKKIFWTRKDYS